MNKFNSAGAFTAVFGVAAVLSAAYAQQSAVGIRSTSGVDQRIPIAVPPFPTDSGAAAFGREMASVVSEDLAFTGVFTIVPESQYPQGFPGFPPDPSLINFEAWRTTPAEHLAFAYITTDGNGIASEARLYDVPLAQQVVGKRLGVDGQEWSRLLAHRYADEIVLFVTGVEGVATSEICFSAGQPGTKEIYISDYDGANVTQVTKHNSISIKPKISPDGRKIAYLSYKDRFPFLYVYDRQTGVSTPLSKRVGLNHAPAWSPNGNEIALVLSKDGNTEIYVKDADGTGERRLTNDRGADTSPTFSPDGNEIAFVSDRAGKPEIYVMSSSGANPRRISFQGGNSYDPVWSPDGRSIAYVVEKSGEGLEIYVMDANGGNARRLTSSAGSNESPSWSADSRHVIFSSTRGGYPQLHVVTVETGDQRRLERLAHLRAEGPSWGPRRK